MASSAAQQACAKVRVDDYLRALETQLVLEGVDPDEIQRVVGIARRYADGTAKEKAAVRREFKVT